MIDKSEYFRRYYQANREKLIARATARNQANKLSRRAYCREYYHKTKTEPVMTARRERQKLRYWQNPERARTLAKKYRATLRMEFIAAYGGVCACCHENESAFLTLEHKNRDGAAHRKQFSTSTSILRFLKRNAWPKDDYELLCFNCNRASWENGVCPHRTKGVQDK